jgi:hypothetical protein
MSRGSPAGGLTLRLLWRNPRGTDDEGLCLDFDRGLNLEFMGCGPNWRA